MTRRIFCDKDKALIEELYPSTPTAQIAEMLNCKLISVYHFANNRGIKKSEEFMNSMLSGRIGKLSELGAKYRFKKGNTPVNKGKKMPPHVYEKVKHTMFKKGDLPHNTTHFGEPYIHIRKRKNGYEEKVWMIQHNQKRKAYLKHMCIMAGVDMTNKIPRLKDGYDYSKVPTIDDVIIIDRRINLEMNSFHNYPQEIKDVIHIKAVLTRQINKQLKDE